MFSTEEIKKLAEIERDMDSGKQTYVVSDGGRWALDSDLMKECGVESGQTVTHTIVTHLMQKTLANIQTKIAIAKAMAD